MKNKEKTYSIALASTLMVLFLIFASSTASASTGEDLHKAPPDITSGAGDSSDDKALSDELSIEGKSTVMESVQPASLKITEKRITTDEADSRYPAIYGNTIVWEDCRSEDRNWDIYMYNLSTSKETRITANSSDQYYPDVYGNRIVWEDWRNDDTNSNCDIYMYDLSTSKETPLITNDDSGQRCPAIYGDKVVWMDWGRGDEDVSNIYMYDLSTSTETRLTTSGMAYNPDIYGNRIVWEEERGDNYDIYMYDLSTSTETQITNNGSDQLNPVIYGDRIVWEDWRNDDSGLISDIYMYNLSTKKETQITNSTSNSRYPAIYGNRIVWENDRNGNWDIYVYDLATRQQTHTTETSAQYRPNIYGDKIVWEDVRNGNDDIYMGTLSSTSLVAAFSASPTSGKAPLMVAFTDKSTGSPTKWKWTFGDGTSSKVKNPTHKYSQEGNYTVKLTVTNDAGSSTKTKTNYIKVTTNTRPGIYSKSK
ncbi:PKD domain-containing protein [Methanosarcina sp. UBA5]|uniref:PKD domain-containing protein n=1 Tax=Methanosarcina sp. UBA5 TaxID=1915593 RepID=UPI0025E4BDC1|nr:PKD domain-containing protein [Methanosarcina sp. UBA5]